MKNKDLIEKIGVVPQDFLKDDDKKEVYVFSGVKDDRKVLVKIAKSDSDDGKCYRAEVTGETILKDSKVSRVKVLSSGESDGFFWVVREYISGCSLTDYGEALTLYGYDILREDVLSQKEKILSGVVENLNILQSISSSATKKRFPVDVENLPHLGSLPISPDGVFAFYRANQNKYNPAKEVLCVNDLVPANIIYSEDKKVYLSDFSFLGVDNYLIDAAYLWLFLWRHPDWQKILVGKVVKTDFDVMSFKMSIIRLVLFWYNSFYKYNLEKTDALTKERFEAYAHHVWLDYLKKIDSLSIL